MFLIRLLKTVVYCVERSFSLVHIEVFKKILEILLYFFLVVFKVTTDG